MGECSRFLLICNKRGLHARASVRFVQCAEQFEADIHVTKDGHVVGATSIMGLMMLAAGIGTEIQVTASGPQAAAAIDALDALVKGKFGEED